jgi:serine/threonine protein kinase
MANAYLLKILAKGQKISTRLYEKLMADSSLDSITKKRITMYYKGDKRLAIDKLIAKLKKKTMHGGVVQFFTFKDTKYMTGKELGKGEFATVYELKIVGNPNEDTQLCVKIFSKNQNDIVQNISSFETEFRGIENTTLLPTPPCNETCNYYVMKMVQQDPGINPYNTDAGINNITNVLKTHSTTLSKHRLQFVHGDIKLANILVKSDTVAITDYDNVMTYDKDGKIVVYDNDAPLYKAAIANVAVTPLFTHPLYFVWVKYNYDLETIDKTIDVIKVWKAALKTIKTSEAIVVAIETVLQACNYESFIIGALNSKAKFVKAISSFDTYSFAVSLLYTCLSKKVSYECAKMWVDQGFASASNTKMVESYEIMYNKSCELLKDCFTVTEGGRKKVQKGGSPPPLLDQLIKNVQGMDTNACLSLTPDLNTTIVDINSLFPPKTQQ